MSAPFETVPLSLKFESPSITAPLSSKLYQPRRITCQQKRRGFFISQTKRCGTCKSSPCDRLSFRGFVSSSKSSFAMPHSEIFNSKPTLPVHPRTFQDTIHFTSFTMKGKCVVFRIHLSNQTTFLFTLKYSLLFLNSSLEVMRYNR